jgi:hypothetical protein
MLNNFLILIQGVPLAAFCIKDIYVFQQAFFWFEKPIKISQ